MSLTDREYAFNRLENFMREKTICPLSALQELAKLARVEVKAVRLTYDKYRVEAIKGGAIRFPGEVTT